MKPLVAVALVAMTASVSGLRKDDDAKLLKGASERLEAALQKAATTYDGAVRRAFDAYNSELESGIRAAEKSE